MNGRPWPWRKASASDAAGSQCVEVCWTGHHILVRDSVRPKGPHVSLPPDAWQTFLHTLRDPSGRA